MAEAEAIEDSYRHHDSISNEPPRLESISETVLSLTHMGSQAGSLDKARTPSCKQGKREAV